MEELKKRIIFYCFDIIKPFTVKRHEDVEYWRILDEKKFKAHIQISTLIFQYFNNTDKEEDRIKYFRIIKFIHDDIQFITTDLSKSIGFKFNEIVTNEKLEKYANELAETIIEYVKGRKESYFINLFKTFY